MNLLNFDAKRCSSNITDCAEKIFIIAAVFICLMLPNRTIAQTDLAVSAQTVSHPDWQNSRVLRWAHVYEPSHALHKWALWASDEIYRETQGRYKVEIYASSSLGKEAHINQSLSLGSLDIIYTGTSFASQMYKPLGLSEMPYIFENYQHWQRYVASSVFAQLTQEYQQRSAGNVILSSTYYGERHLTSNRPVIRPEQIRGLKIRVPGAEIYQLFPLALGAKPSPISFSEVYLAIQQGVVDAQENPLPTIKAKKFYEVQSNINLTGHVLGSILAVASGRTWDLLSKDDRAIFTKVLRVAAQKASEETRYNEQNLSKWFEQQGVTVNQVERNAFRQQVLNFYEHTTFSYDRSIYDLIQGL
ncbi:sialic acid TRAP transporter substrate-binding protein SiaP [Paraglaciecola arctica]|uniref:sialic acid TRAP transporter substrate-binding protein SiaP n=1 Tax=Paraglaciecola arctica TaxID=1128911 RepID=UPI001C06892E|nr:sialic acid TRAP transporter substrate-binding protein SiaP [Paraglaciecola arctica]MBU3005345.1 sialic acid TRAP transporter substrate-binding protein SiaP [Paraglaciecola arctica]